MYAEYLKHLVNSVVPPDSLAVLEYYNENKDLKYLEKEKVVVQELRVNNFFFLDSLYNNIQQQPVKDRLSLFESYCLNYSKTNPAKRGLLNPFGRGRFGKMGEAVWLLGVGDFSSVVKNEDNTFSMVFIKEKHDGGYIPIERVYKQVESLLTKNLQDKIKTSGIGGLFENYDIKINQNLFSF